MLATTHALTGAYLGRHTRSRVAALAAGLASHVVLDVLPHWGVASRTDDPDDARTFWRVAVADGLVTAATLLWLARRGQGTALAGAVGAVTPDLNKPAEVVGIGLWGERANRWHADIQRLEGPRRWPVDVVVTAAALAGLRVRGRRGAPR